MNTKIHFLQLGTASGPPAAGVGDESWPHAVGVGMVTHLCSRTGCGLRISYVEPPDLTV